MNEQNSPYRIVRYISKNKPVDRYIFSQFHFTVLHNQPVVLVCFVEIANPWHPAREGAQIISQQLLREFNRSDNQSTITKFENTLKSLNKTLSDLEERVETAINCAVLALTKNEVHFSTIGQARVLLARNGVVSDVAAGQDNSRRTTFAAVTSGDLSENDWLLCASDTFYQVAKSVDSAVWSSQNERELFNDLASLTEPASLPLMTAISLRLGNDKPKQETFVWEENEQRLPIHLPKLAVSAPAIPSFRLNLSRVHELWQNLRRPHKQDQIGVKTQPEVLDGDTSPHQPRTLTGATGLKFVTTFFASFKDLFRGRLSRRSRLPLFAIAVFIVLLIIGISLIRDNFKRSTESNAPSQTLVDQIRGTSPDQVASVLKDKFTAASYQDLTDSQKSELTTFLANSGITFLDKPASLTDLPNPIIKLALNSTSQIYSLDSTGQLWRFDGRVNNKINQQTLIQQPVDLAIFSDQKIVASDTAGNIWLFDNSATQPISLPLPSKLALGQKYLQAYQGNLYLRNPDGSVYRVSNFASTLDSATLLTKAGTVPFTNPADWLITGQVYAISQSGQLVNFSKSKLGSVNTPVVPTLGSYRIAGNTNEIAIASGPVIWRYTSAGTLIKTYYLATDKPIEDIIYLGKSQYLVSIGDQIFQLDLS